MKTEISSQEAFDSIKSKFAYSEYRKFSEVYYFPDGTKYVGEFQKNKFHGRGLMVWNHKSACLGIFNRGKLEGKCLIHKPKSPARNEFIDFKPLRFFG